MRETDQETKNQTEPETDKEVVRKTWEEQKKELGKTLKQDYRRSSQPVSGMIPANSELNNINLTNQR